MRIFYLGTAAAEGWPALFCHCDNCERAREAGGKNLRTRPQVLINENLLMDFGPDTFYHAMEYKLDMAKVETVLMTHSHTDHFYTQELILRAFPYAYDRDKNKMRLYGNAKCRDMFQRTLDVDDDSANMRDCVDFHLSWEFRPFTASGYEITPLRARHDNKESCLIYSIKDQEGKCVLYGNDTGYFPEDTWEHLKGMYFDVVSLDCTMGGQQGNFYGHMCLDDNKKVKERMLEIGCADENTRFVMTHFSHNGGLLHHELEERAEEMGFTVAYDGMILEI